ncbi:MAG: hypothetical protein JG777_1764 [Clostridia bacterium]|jgi:archaeosortase C (PEF-CTERM variant)|nr:hypothetical protein [Clostridia bacterium]
MQDENRNVVIILLVLALFTGATIELSEGSTTAGIALFIAAAFMISRIKLKGTEGLESSKKYMLIGGFIVLIDLVYNIVKTNGVGTLDSMVFLIGVSLIAMGTNKKDIKQLGEFGLYISSVFTALYLVFYTLFGRFNIDFIHLFDHYFVLTPTVALLKVTGIPVEIIAIETITIQGLTETMTIVIGGPCSGLYSMFLLMGIVVAYSKIEKIDIKKSLTILLFAICVAYIANLVRVFTLYVVAYRYGMDTMMIFHTHLGWILFAGTAGLIMYIMNRKDLLKK